MSTELTVVIPTLNEAAALPALLGDLRGQAGVALQIVVADGGSSDETRALAKQAGATVVAAPRGRGAQMNAGAQAAQGEFLLFLHADSRLESPAQLRQSLDALKAESGRVAGHFVLRFSRMQPGHELFYHYAEGKTGLGRPGTINGDQGLLIGSAFFHELDGFDERLPFLEDQRIAARIFERGRWLLLPGALTTSARRFEAEGPYRRYTLMALIMGLHAAGADEFFEQAPKVYAAHGEGGKLAVGAYLALLWRVLRAAGWRRGFGIVWRASRYARQNSWQLFYWLDTALRTRERPWLRLHDRLLYPLTNNAIFDAIATLVIGTWYLAVLPLAYALIDQRRPSPS